MDTFGIGVDAGQIQNLMQTDLYEARDLLSWRLLGYIIVIMLVPLYWLWRKPLESQSFFTQFKERVYGVVLSMTLIGSIAMLFYVDYAAIFRENRTVLF